nr:hypothetical protein Q903MT_gene6576 [Picea sitchensis]
MHSSHWEHKQGFMRHKNPHTNYQFGWPHQLLYLLCIPIGQIGLTNIHRSHASYNSRYAHFNLKLGVPYTQIIGG